MEAIEAMDRKSPGGQMDGSGWRKMKEQTDEQQSDMLDTQWAEASETVKGSLPVGPWTHLLWSDNG